MSLSQTNTSSHTNHSVKKFLEHVLHAGPSDWPKLRTQAQEILTDLLRLSMPNRTHAADASVPKSAYDAWMVELFMATESAVPREALLRDFAHRFAQVHGNAEGKAQGARILVLHYLAAQGSTPAQVSGFYQQGMSAHQWQRFQEQLAQHQSDPALAHLFVERNRFEKDYLPYAQQAGLYAGVFDAALGRVKHSRKEDWLSYGPNAWVSAQPLFGNDMREGHAVVMLYPSDGSYFEGREPAKAGQDLRLLDVLSAVYRQLDHQVKNLALQVLRAREQLLAQLGPAVLQHEVGGITRQALALLQDGLTDWRAYEEVYEPPPMVANMGQRLELLGQNLNKMLTTAEAFMNLERRGSVHEFDIEQVLRQIERLVVVRCGSMGAKLRFHSVLDAPDSVQTPKRLHNDSTLIMHALLNMVNNALDAMQDRREARQDQDLATPLRSVIEIRWTQQRLPSHCVGWDVVNTGPPIPASAQHRVFERGFTTRRQGHGQGLHLVRMTAQYCGGNVALLPPDALQASAGETVGFVYWVARAHTMSQALSV